MCFDADELGLTTNRLSSLRAAIGLQDGTGVGELLDAVAAVHERWTKRISTGHLNNWLKRTQTGLAALPGGARLKFITQACRAVCVQPFAFLTLFVPRCPYMVINDPGFS